jgi:putative tryptophan/tyrosine transport system substrate-binding protein
MMRAVLTISKMRRIWTIPQRARRIGVLLGIANDAETQPIVSALQRRLQELGWVEGRTIEFDCRWAAGDVDLGRSHAMELLRLAPDVIVTNSTVICEVLRNATRTMPIVFVGLSDPVGIPI